MAQKWDNIEFEVILRLISGEAHLRQISKDTGIPRSTVSRKLGSLRNQLIVDYKIEGKNNIFFLRKNLVALKAIISAENYKFTKTTEKYTFLLPIFEQLYRIKGPIILFGSYAKGIAKEDSDIDIYIDSHDKSLKGKAEAIYGKLSVKTGIFNNQDLLMQEIEKNHVIIKGAEEYYERLGFLD